MSASLPEQTKNRPPPITLTLRQWKFPILQSAGGVKMSAGQKDVLRSSVCHLLDPWVEFLGVLECYPGRVPLCLFPRSREEGIY